ncbi:hypothetical protein KFE25_006278 [Diacronema lutheri]|uniref:Uncharacterized protein n=1 Tax=Diacronema lutheri TaxID=2081491 RepID=A0A8J6CJE0_DIALT|nr:hypothetical protein KFE25_006278 [Diacronema lutheri]
MEQVPVLHVKDAVHVQVTQDGHFVSFRRNAPLPAQLMGRVPVTLWLALLKDVHAITGEHANKIIMQCVALVGYTASIPGTLLHIPALTFTALSIALVSNLLFLWKAWSVREASPRWRKIVDKHGPSFEAAGFTLMLEERNPKTENYVKNYVISRAASGV